MTLPFSNIHVVPKQLSNTDACFTEHLAASLQVLEQFHIKPSFWVLVVGDGKLGQLMVKILASHPCELYLVGHHPKKYLSYQKLGVIVGDEHLITHNDFDGVIGCSGQASGFELAIKAIKPKGTIVLKSTFKDKQTYNFLKKEYPLSQAEAAIKHASSHGTMKIMLNCQI